MNKNQPSLCLHCGTPTPSPDDDFCCSGCEFVHQTLTSEGLDRFYDLKGNHTGIPVKDRPFQPQDLSWLDSATAHQTSLTTAINGVTCIGCVWLIEKLFLNLPGAQSAAIFPDTGQATFTWEPGTNPLLDLAAQLPRYGYSLAPLDLTKKIRPESSRLLARLGICAAFAMNAMAFTLPRYLGMRPDFAYARFFELITLLSATFCLLLGGSYFFTRALAALRRGTIHIDLPISLGLILAFLGSLAGYFLGESNLLYFDFVGIFTTLMLTGRYLHLAASEKARSNLTQSSPLPETLQLLPKDGTRTSVRPNKQEIQNPKSAPNPRLSAWEKQPTKEIPTRTLTPGDTFLLPPGQPLPVTAFLENHPASLSLAWINGEPEPRTFQPGQRIPSGAINLSQKPLTLTADEPFSQSLVAKLTQPANRPETSPLLQKILKAYLLLVLLIGLGGGLAWLLTTGNPVAALQVAISIFIVSCPCALGVAIPLADRRAATHLQTFGVFIQNPALWHRLTRLKNLLFDKTGTLTLEHPVLKNPATLTNLTPGQRAILHHLTSQSLHPLSRTLHAELSRSPNLPAHPPTPVTETPAKGLSTTINHHTYQLGKPKPSYPETQTSSLISCSFTLDDQTLATFQFQESARPDAARVLAAIKLPVHILSGDHPARVKTLATSLNLTPDNAHGNLTPQQKAALVHHLNPALYLGDGANDSLAFDAASVTGSPVADRSLLDAKADFLFTQRGLHFLPHLLATARWRHTIVRRILAFTIIYNLIAVTLCLAGLMNPLLAAILMPLSSLFSLLLASASLGNQKKQSRQIDYNLEPTTVPI